MILQTNHVQFINKNTSDKPIKELQHGLNDEEGTKPVVQMILILEDLLKHMERFWLGKVSHMQLKVL